ncbi:ribonuclease J [Butyricicoccus faecihominis]|uniref:ribonuclease J n=1 Tax=Butyricicoccaceae TaxID=3085642 RepID=UPI002478BBFD|nr:MULTISPECIES: ribonuclease J [Butyricicoccaceae]MCQ5131196.1 ribonuclease J [Butyricicoccus faecihominis]WNX83637.1 ribonuclease J [Agathobaculum sp. NTUH-O15-33]
MKEKLKIIPLGGLNEIGKNMTVIEYGNDMLVIDCGIAFPDDDMLGVDLVIPDTTYIKRNLAKLRGYVITHGHEDHIGAIPYVLRECNAPVYATKLTCGIIEAKLSEHRMPQKVKLSRVRAGDTIKLGCFKVEFIHTNHSIADSVALAITTPLGVLFHTGDFKIDLTPDLGEMIDLVRIGELGKKGILALMSDSTNVERPGYTPSEKTVRKSLEKFIMESDQRIIIATFASNVSRLQQILDIAALAGRKVAVCGRSMEKISSVATELGYLQDTGKTMIDISDIRRYPRNQLIIVSTGSQGETMSALYRMAYGSHKQVEVSAGDRILIAASAIPGNEKSVNNMVNELYKQGAEVIYDRSAAIHVSGHACQEEQKLMIGLCKPKYFIPVHGEYRMLVQHANIAREMGVNPKNVLISEIGRPIEIGEGTARLANPVPAGRLLVDGLGIGDVGTAVLRDRKHLSEDGLLVVVVTVDATTGVVIAGPDIVSRGFVYVKEAEDLMEELRKLSQAALDRCATEGVREWNGLKSAIKGDLSDFLFKKTKRSPMVLPIIMEI